ncbi:MAG: alpha-amylase, partial [Bacteroidetes bacterium]|nr:alpha-amylase [Bacteroidota bacterium]
EMVTDEDRQFMWDSYNYVPEAKINLGIRLRLARLMDGRGRKMELINMLLFSMPGTPVIYYGDEIGMGDNCYLNDRDGVRTPMQWNASLNAGFSNANPQQLYLPLIIDPEFHYRYINVEVQETKSRSLLNWMRKIIAIRRGHKAFGRGSMKMLYPENEKILAYTREYEGETILIVANLSRSVQVAWLDLTEYAGKTAYELFGEIHFPEITSTPYLLTMSSFGYYWLKIE